MARTWLTITVELLSGIYAECDPARGRVFLVGPRHTFQQLARAINVGFARWDHSHLYDFELADGNIVGFPDTDFGEEDVLDHATTKVLDRAGPGDRFGYRFDFGHECMVEPEKVDPIDVYGDPPVEPVPVFGWGTIPDQYGRITEGRDDESLAEPEIPFPFLHDELVRIHRDQQPRADDLGRPGRHDQCRGPLPQEGRLGRDVVADHRAREQVPTALRTRRRRARGDRRPRRSACCGAMSPP
jgi:hypothetical protein